MKELSIFVDESGDFGEYDYHSPYYIITMVFHNQTIDISENLAKLISSFIREHLQYFLDFDEVKVYYDNGQVEVTKILSSVLNVMFQNVIFRKVIPSKFRLFQVADLICSFKLISIKAEKNALSQSEKYFFPNARDFKKNYLRHIEKKELK